MNPLSVVLALVAHWLFGAAYVAWRSRRTGKDLSPMGLLRHLDRHAATHPAMSVLPVAVIVGVVSAAYVVILTFWPVLALRRLAVSLGLTKGA